MTQPITLLPVAVRDALIRELVETNHYLDEATRELYEPTEPPEVHDPDRDADSE
jgi:hypothetical protein